MTWNAKNSAVPVKDTAMRYVSFGHGKRSAVILPGLSDGLTTVKGKALLLAPHYRSFFDEFTVTMFSRKDTMPEGYSIRDMADDQAVAMQALGLEGSFLMGVSEGGMIAGILAAEHPELVKKLVLAVTAPCMNGLIRENVTCWIGYAEKGDHRSLMIDTAERSYSPAYLKKYRRMYPVIGLVGKQKDYGRFLVNAKAILGFEGSEKLGNISCPTLVIGGIPGSALYMYEGLGHAAYEEAKDYNARVFGFFRTGGE